MMFNNVKNQSHRKRIIYTQRVDSVASYEERRDAADQRIPFLLYKCNYLPAPVMNHKGMALDLCRAICADGIVLTGGNDLSMYGGDAPERDEAELQLLKYAIQNELPVLGICRGMQVIATYFGCTCSRVKNHVNTSHSIRGLVQRDCVNSFHGFAVERVHESIMVMATSPDGIIEAIQHEKLPIAGIMWHPERVEGFDEKDLELISSFFERGEIGG